MSKTVKIIARSEQNTGVWTPEGKSPLYKFKYTFDDGVEGTAQHQKDEPKYNVGEEVTYKVTRENQYGKMISISKPDGFSGKSSKTIKTNLSQVKKMCKSNALAAVAKVGLKATALESIVSFTMGGISSDIDKFGQDSDDLTSRLSAVNTASLMGSYDSVESFLSQAEKNYKYIVS